MAERPWSVGTPYEGKSCCTCVYLKWKETDPGPRLAVCDALKEWIYNLGPKGCRSWRRQVDPGVAFAGF
jgi:hypothetical protein